MTRYSLFALLTCLLLAGNVHSQAGSTPAKGVTITLNPDGTVTIGNGQQKLIVLTDEQINALRVLQSIKLPEIPKQNAPPKPAPVTPKPTVKDAAKDEKDKSTKDAKDKPQKDVKDKKDDKKGSTRLEALERDIALLKVKLAPALSEKSQPKHARTERSHPVWLAPVPAKEPQPKNAQTERKLQPKSAQTERSQPRGPHVVVKLPPRHEDAPVYFDGAKTKSAGLVREYRSDPILSTGEQYYYEVATIINGMVHRQDAVVHNNATTTVDFSVPE